MSPSEWYGVIHLSNSSYYMGKLNLVIEFKINGPDIYLFHGKRAEAEFVKMEPVFVHVSF